MRVRHGREHAHGTRQGLRATRGQCVAYVTSDRPGGKLCAERRKRIRDGQPPERRARHRPRNGPESKSASIAHTVHLVRLVVMHLEDEFFEGRRRRRRPRSSSRRRPGRGRRPAREERPRGAAASARGVPGRRDARERLDRSSGPAPNSASSTSENMRACLRHAGLSSSHTWRCVARWRPGCGLVRRRRSGRRRGRRRRR